VSRVRSAPAALLLLAAVACRAEAEWSVLVFSKTAGFRHASIADGQALLAELGAAHGFATVASEDAAIFTAAGLARFHAVVFLNTTGDVLEAAQQSALRCFVESGSGWVGVHSAADTEHAWPWYGTLLGGDAWFAVHPAIQAATLVRESATHPSTAHLPASFAFTDEWYNFAANPRPAVDVLLTRVPTTPAPARWATTRSPGRTGSAPAVAGTPTSATAARPTPKPTSRLTCWAACSGPPSAPTPPAPATSSSATVSKGGRSARGVDRH
jgi:type 1 glutamine amidotransferase